MSYNASPSHFQQLGYQGGSRPYSDAPEVTCYDAPELSSYYQQQPVYHDAPEVSGHHPQHDALDAELLAETPHYGHGDTSLQASDEQEAAALDKNLQWLAQSRRRPRQGGSGVLARPVLIPQTSPGIQMPFSRAWVPNLSEFDVHPEDFLQFLDHLNVCKAASPPFQVLNLAGTVLGFTPIPFASLVGMGTSAAAVGGQVAVAKVRVTKYLQRVNKEYFVPRGLMARIAKQPLLPQITGIPEYAPLLSPIPPGLNNSGSLSSIRDRRMQAMGNRIAYIEYRDLPPQHEEYNMIDKLSAKMMAHKAQRCEKKMAKEHRKDQEDEMKEREKLMEEEAKLQSKMRKDPHKRAELEAKMAEARAKYEEKVGESGKDDIKGAKKLLYVVIVDLQTGKNLWK